MHNLHILVQSTARSVTPGIENLFAGRRIRSLNPRRPSSYSFYNYETNKTNSGRICTEAALKTLGPRVLREDCGHRKTRLVACENTSWSFERRGILLLLRRVVPSMQKNDECWWMWVYVVKFVWVAWCFFLQTKSIAEFSTKSTVIRHLRFFVMVFSKNMYILSI